MERGQFTFYASFAKAAERIRKKADRCDFYDAVKDYAIYGKEPDLDVVSDTVAVAFELVRPTLDASKRKAESGKRGGTAIKPEAQGSKGKQTESKRKQSESKPEAERSKPKQTASEKEGEKENEKEDECPPPLTPQGVADFSPALQAAVDSWLRYKTEKRQGYKPEGLKKLIGQIRNNAKVYGEDAVISLIDDCMASNWQGIIFEQLKRQQNRPGGQRGQERKSWTDICEEMEGAT